MMKFAAYMTMSVLAAAALAGCAASTPELANDEWACVHFAEVNEKLSVNYLDATAEGAENWQEAIAALDETEEMANGDLPELIRQAHDALPASPLGDVAEFDRVVTDIDAACELPDDGDQIQQLQP